MRRIQDHWIDRKAGYRKGVVLVPIQPEGFYTPVVTLKPGDVLSGIYEARRPGEDPRKVVTVKGNKAPAHAVDVVLYHDSVLAEDGEATGHEWNIVAINAHPCTGEVPIDPDTLIANHFGLSGGTRTNMTPEAFEAALRASVLFWKDKALVGG